MGPLEREEARRRGQARIEGMRRRARLLRKRIVVSGLFVFVLLWAVVFGQMLSGHDPVLSRLSGAGTSPAAAEGSVPKVTLVGRSAAGEESENNAPPAEAELRNKEERATTEQAELEQVEAEEQELEPVMTGQS